MNISQLLEALKGDTSTLTMSEKLVGGLSVAALSMVVVFIILVIIAIIIKMLQAGKSSDKPQVKNEVAVVSVNNTESPKEDMEELVSVITAAICQATKNNPNNIVVKKIVRTNNSKTSWENMRKNITK